MLLHSHLNHRCLLVFGKIMNNMLFWVLYIDLYTRTSSLCCMVLLGTSPTSFLGEVHFFFSGLPAGPTYWPPVRHSNPDTPLPCTAVGCRRCGEACKSFLRVVCLEARTLDCICSTCPEVGVGVTGRRTGRQWRGLLSTFWVADSGVHWGVLSMFWDLGGFWSVLRKLS